MNEVAQPRETSGAEVRVLGVRHHGPGSARTVREVLGRFEPDALLVEGPADADPVTALAASDDLVPPVALLAYGVDDPKKSVFWPMAAFSPEWVAIRWAVRRRVPVKFIDLPASIVLADEPVSDDQHVLASPIGPLTQRDPADPEYDDDHDETLVDDRDDSDEVAAAAEQQADRSDPIAQLARAAGYDDPERWWDDVIEGRRHAGQSGADDENAHPDDPMAVFDAVTEAMQALRAHRGSAADETAALREQRREAHMRQMLRAALKEGKKRIVVVCGAWHAPALTGPLGPAAPDARMLRGLPKRKVALTWVPWTHSRLSYDSGYGAGVESPGWYAHLFTTTERPVAHWLTRVAAVLRAEDLPISTAHVIEAVRLADTLATLRGRGSPGLAEVTDATRAAMCHGDDATLGLVTKRLVVGEALGRVPLHTPTVPIESDLAATCRRLRLTRDPNASTKDLDLRRPGDVERSVLLHRLRLLGIDWANPSQSLVRSTGTFRETWDLRWRPELAVDVITAAVWGTTVASAAGNRACSDALGLDLPGLTAMIEKALSADLSEALPALLAALDLRAAHDHDLAHLMRALPPLVRARRYGDVRGTDLSSLDAVVDALLARICAGLGQAAAGLDESGAQNLTEAIEEVNAAVALHTDPDGRGRWLAAVRGLLPRADVHALVVGRSVRLLVDGGVLDSDEAAGRLSRALSVGSPPQAKAAWVEGFLAGSGLLLVHDRDLLRLLDVWVQGLKSDDFDEIAPLLRRSFGRFETGERRAIGQGVRHLSTPDRATEAAADSDWSRQRSAPAVDTVARLLGLRPLTGEPR